jgi:multidrug efflux pump subunit AcrA (membrane-fusion protein)
MFMKRLLFLSIFIVSLTACNQSRTIHPARKNITETVYASGKIMADSEYTIYALNPGAVIKKLVKEGDKVSKDQVLYVINNTAPAARLEAADVSYTNAQQNLSASSRILGDLRLSMQSADIKFSNDSLQYQRPKN